MSENTVDHKYEDLVIVGIGASAGGLEALQELISHLPEKLEDVAIIVAQHLSPTYKSMLVPLLGRETRLNVIEAQNNLAIRENNIYITPPDREIKLKGGYIRLEKSNTEIGPRPSIDLFFESISIEKREKAIGIILSGTGSDGSRGILAIKKHGGITIAQEPKTAKYEGMPIGAIETGQVDLVLPPEKIGDELLEILAHPPLEFKSVIVEKKSSFEKILGLLSERTGTDFSNYKPSTLCRRLEKRIIALKMNSLEEYLEYIKEIPIELDQLFDNVLIGVTTFFRDTEAYQSLEKYLKSVVATKIKGEPIRIWVAGCATGEEPYSIAILLAQLTQTHFSDLNLQIFATDIDERAISIARRGIYTSASVENLPEDILGKYFLRKGNEYELIKSIRQSVLFSKHDLTNNPPFLKLDLISCRNLLIYFGSGLQKHVIPVFHYALNPTGYLFLGKSETVGQFSDLFVTLDAKAKIYQRKGGRSIHSIKFSAFSTKLPGLPSTTRSMPQVSEQSLPEMIKDTLFNTYENPYVVIKDTMDVVEVHGDVRMFLSLNQGILNSNILKLINKDLQLDARSLISQAVRENIEAKGKSIHRIEYFNNEYFVRMAVKPLAPSSGSAQFLLFVFEKIDYGDTNIKLNNIELKDIENHRINELEQELTATKEHLQTFIEELETSNEELQSLNEELQSANEELQSSNEELETTNEELQSTNEELQIAYTELKSAYEEIEKQNLAKTKSEANFKALLNNTLQSFILIDRDYRIIAFNSVAQQSVKVEQSKIMKVGDSIIDYLGSGFLSEFQRNVQKALKGEFVESEIKLDNNKSGSRWYKANFTPVSEEPSGNVEIISFSLLDITELKNAIVALEESERLINSIYNAADVGICVTDENGRFVAVNDSYCRIYGYERDELVGKPFTIVLPPEMEEPANKIHKAFLEGAPESAGEWIVRDKQGNNFPIQVTAGRMRNARGAMFKVTTVTDLRPIQRIKEERNLAFYHSPDMVVILQPNGAITEVNPSWAQTIDPNTSMISGKRLIDYIYANDRYKVNELLTKLRLDQGVEFIPEVKLIGSNNKPVWTSLTLKRIPDSENIYAYFRDISQSKNLTLLLEHAYTSIGIGGVQIHLPHDEVICSGFLCSLLGINNHSTVSFAQFLAFFSDKSRPILQSALERYGNKPMYEVELASNFGSKKLFFEDKSTSDDKANQLFTFIVKTDEQLDENQAQKVIVELKQQIIESSKLRSAFLANLSHEIRTPLNGILGMAEIIEDHTESAEVLNLTKLIDRSGKRLLNTINTIVDFAKLEEGLNATHFSEESLESLLNTVIEAFVPIANDKGVELIGQISLKNQKVLCDRGLLIKAFENVISNAFKYTNEGYVKISASEIENHTLDANFVEIIIEDTGVGINPAVIERIFEPFFQESTGYDRNYEGSGLGLTLSKKIIDLIGGSIIVESEKEKGSKFFIYLPVLN